MAIQQRKIRQTGGGRVAQSGGVTQLQTPSRNTGGDLGSLAKSLGVLLDPTISDHEQKKLDQVNQDAFNEVQMATAGQSQEVKQQAMADIRVEADKANPQGFMGKLLGQENTKLNRYDELTAQQMVNHATLSASHMEKTFTADENFETRSGKMEALYTKLYTDANEMSPQVGANFANTVAEGYNNKLEQMRNAEDIRLTAVNVDKAKDVNTTLANSFVDPTVAQEALKTSVGLKEFTDAQFTQNEDGTRSVDPKLLSTVKASIDKQMSDAVLFGSTDSKAQLNAGRFDMAGEVSSFYMNPQLYQDMINEKQANGQTWAEMHPKESQSTLASLIKKTNDHRSNMYSSDQKAFTASSKAGKDAEILRMTEMEIRANEGSVAHQNELALSLDTVTDHINNNPNKYTDSDKTTMLLKAQNNTNQYSTFVSDVNTETHNSQLLAMAYAPDSIANADEMLLLNSKANPETKAFFKAQYAKYTEMTEGKTAGQVASLRDYISTVRRSPQEAMNVAITEMNQMATTSGELSKSVLARKFTETGFVTPNGQKLKQDFNLKYKRYIYEKNPVTVDEWEEVSNNFMSNELPKFEKAYSSEITRFINESQVISEDTRGKLEAEREGTTEPNAETRGKPLAGASSEAPAKPTVAQQQATIDKMRKEDPDTFYAKVIESGNAPLIQEELTNLGLRGLESRGIPKDQATPYDAIQALVEDMPDDIVGEDVDAMLESMAPVIGQLIQKLGTSSNPQLQRWLESNESLDFQSFDRDGTMQFGKEALQLLLSGDNIHTRDRIDGLPESFARLQETLRKKRGGDKTQ